MLAAGGVAALLALGGACVLLQSAAVAAGFYAKQLCSEVFVASREPEAVVADDLSRLRPAPLMRLMRWSVSRSAAQVQASYLGLVSRIAHYRRGAGCSLAYAEPDTAGPDADPAPRSNPHAPGAMADWPSAPVANRRLDSVVERAFQDAPEPSLQRCTRAVLIVHQGRVLAERYASGFSVSSRFPGWSIAKSVAHALTGVLVAQGQLRLDDPVPLAAWSGDERRSITWEHLLRMRAGLAFDESYVDPRSDVNLMLFGSPDAAAVAAAAPLHSPPGSAWQYSSGATNLLAHAWRKVLPADVRYEDFPRRALFDRIGMSSAVLEADQAGDFVASSFIYATARDFARFGWLYAMDGVWRGERVLPPGWVAHALLPTSVSKDGIYGAHFWTSVPAQHRHRFRQPLPEMLHAAGFGGQRITILPSERTVIVRLGCAAGHENWDHWSFVAEVLDVLAPRSELPLASRS